MIALALFAQILLDSLPDGPRRLVAPATEMTRTGSSTRVSFIDIRAAPYSAPCNGTDDDEPALNSAIGSLPSTGGVIDARSCADGINLRKTLKISKAATVL